MFFLTLVIAVALVVLVLVYNRLVSLRQTTNQAFADIDVQLKQRHDLVPSLVETVKGYAAHEQSTFDKVIAARNQAAAANGIADKAQSEGALSGALGRLFALSEAYPDLKASANFVTLQNELSDIENKLAAARRFFNDAIGTYNASIQQFPAVLFAGMMGFAAREFFDLGDGRAALETAPQVKF